ncbi:MAG: UDP-glucose/GDP-mannose dehydrogenase family protein [Proteobacteria bacterium]|nr:UDP-glucose/GDP-mannose dehydrogenase family protein [Pseudomonadota bacterium]
MNISIFGLGYVGCVSLGCLAKNGHQIIGVDTNETKVRYINKGKSPIIEKGLNTLIAQQFKAGNISATNDSISAIQNSEVSFITVGTPNTEHGHLDLNAIFKVAVEIGKGIAQKKEKHIIVIRSTVLPGTNEKVCEIIGDTTKKNPGKDFFVVSNPEFLREGSAINDYYNPAYTLIGSNDDYAISKMEEIYKDVSAPIIISDIKCAEIIKYVNNAFHALKITFANEVGNICNCLGIDSRRVMEIFCRDNKLNLSPYYLKPGFAYGGSCLPKDLKALTTIANDLYIDSPILKNIDRSNELQKAMAIKKIIGFGKQRLGFLGLSFKAGTDDLRNSPIIDVIEVLLGKGFDIRIFDRNVRLSKLFGANKKFIMEKIPFISKFIINDPDEIIKHSEVLVIVNNDEEFKNILDKVPKGKIIYDLVNIDFKNKGKNKKYKGIAW